MAAKKATKEKETPAPEKRRRLRKSQLRKTLAKLHELEPYALKLIEKSVKEEKDVDKDSLATGKWIITNLITLTKAAVQDEVEINGLRLKALAADAENSAEEEDEADKPPTGAVFSLFVNEAKKDK